MGKHFDKRYWENQIGVWNRSCLWPLIGHHETASQNQESLEFSLYTFKPVWETTFETLWGKLQILLEMKLTTDVTVLFLSAANNVFVYFIVIKTNGCFFIKDDDLLEK